MPPSNSQPPQPPIWQQPPQPPLYPPPVAPPQAEPELPEPQNPVPGPGYPEATPTPSKRRRLVIFGAALLLVVVTAATIFTITNRQETGNPPGGAANADPVPMESLASASLIPPSDLGRFQANAGNTGTSMQYNTVDGGCSLRMGIASEADLPGKDFDEIVKNRVQKLRDAGAVVQGPTGGTPIKVKNVADESKIYTMPTAVFTASNKGTYTGSHYSAAILKDGSRAYAERICETQEALAGPAQLEELDKEAESSGVIAP